MAGFFLLPCYCQVGLVFNCLPLIIMDYEELYQLALSITGDADFADSFAEDHEFFDGCPHDLVMELI